MGRGGGGGEGDEGAQTESEADEAGQKLLGSLPPDESTTSVGLIHFQSCSSASSVCLSAGAVLIMKPPAANTTTHAF